VLSEHRRVQESANLAAPKGQGIVMRGLVLALAILLTPSADAQSTVDVRFTEGLVRGFLVVRAMDGNVLAHGDLAQVSHGAKVTTRLVLRFKDGSMYDETVDFSQKDSFQVLNYHLVQKGPAFKVPIDMTIDRSTGKVRVRYTDEDGEEKVESDRLELPPDLANGMIPVLLKNIPEGVKQTTVSMVAATPKPRLVTLVITAEGEAKFLAGGVSHEATQYRIKVEIGGILGMLAPLVGKQPQDTRAWVLDGDAPVLVRMEGPLFMGGPSWQIEPASPEWQRR
jgi:hypothetical protein